MSLLTLDRVAKRFANGTAALAELSFSVADGEFLSLLGPSGCGKSTALRLIAGLIAPDSGTITWKGQRPELGFVFQEPTLMPWGDAQTNARLPLDLQKIARAEADARAAAALARVGLTAFARAYPRELSGGMKMRVSIARALASRPKLLLMDEPFAALDEPSRQSLNDDLKRLAREDNITVIFVTHSVMEASYLSDRVLVLSPRPGRIKTAIALPPGPRDRLSPAFAESQKQVAHALLEIA
ncbi:MAG TPA: ABC transporter ATP-binding protein [Rhizomicrobium sp.]|jgi:NitT/TauT family transport system ATP-binding protein